MTNFVIDLITSADGYAADKDGGTDWFSGAGDLQETNASQDVFLESLEAIVFGRKTYQMFSAFWPTVDGSEVNAARYVNTLPKYVVSDSLQTAPWGDDQKCTVLRGTVDEYAQYLARKHSGRVVIWGSLSLCRQFLAAGLVDLLRIRTVPLLLGTGAPYLEDSTIPVQLTTLERFAQGNLVLEYALSQN